MKFIILKIVLDRFYRDRLLLTCNSSPTVESSLLSSTKIISFNKCESVRSKTETIVRSNVDRGSFLYVTIKLILGNDIGLPSESRPHFLAAS